MPKNNLKSKCEMQKRFVRAKHKLNTHTRTHNMALVSHPIQVRCDLRTAKRKLAELNPLTGRWYFKSKGKPSGSAKLTSMIIGEEISSYSFASRCGAMPTGVSL